MWKKEKKQNFLKKFQKGLDFLFSLWYYIIVGDWMKVIIAEKPSLARNIANAIGDFKRKDGYLEGNDYLVTWAFGHLFSLYDIEEYSNDANTKWRLDNIPCFPSVFKFGLNKEKNKQVDAGVLVLAV